jgi:hypothetical protein
MTQPHDQFAKQYLSELLEPYGNVKVSREVHEASRLIDVYFSPTAPTTELHTLGLLGRMVSHPHCLLEPFRNQPTLTETRNCILKLFSVHNDLQHRQSKQKKPLLPEAELPRLWILATSASDTLLSEFNAQLNLETWGAGVYFCQAPAFRTALVAINRLPPTPDTLLLRLLGKGATQQQAFDELLALPRDHPLREGVAPLLHTYRIRLEEPQPLTTEEERKLFMNLSRLYQQWENEAVQQGVQRGRFEGQYVWIENLLTFRFGSLDEALSKIIGPVLQLSPAEALPLLLGLSREELLKKFLA